MNQLIQATKKKPIILKKEELNSNSIDEINNEHEDNKINNESQNNNQNNNINDIDPITPSNNDIKKNVACKRNVYGI